MQNFFVCSYKLCLSKKLILRNKSFLLNTSNLFIKRKISFDQKSNLLIKKIQLPINENINKIKFCQFNNLSEKNEQLKKCSQTNDFYDLTENLSEQKFSFTSFGTTRLPRVFSEYSSKKFIDRSLKKTRNDPKMSLDKPGLPKWHLKNIFYLLKKNNEEDEDEIKSKNSNKFDVETSFHKVGDIWECKVALYHPSKKFFFARSKKKLVAEDGASREAIYWLRENEIINMDNKPIVIQKQKLKKYMDSKKGILNPLSVKSFNSAQKKFLEDFISAFELKHKALIENDIDFYLSNETDKKTLNYNDSTQFLNFYYETPEDFNSKNHELFNLISGRPLKKMREKDRDRINMSLSQFINQRDSGEFIDDQYFKLKNKLQNLPIHNFKEELLNLIFDNQVVVISGETGCGKSTQLPQFILEDMIKGGCGADCSILVTQPRRLPAISIAEQCAVQFGEKTVGTSFGYQIRFEKELPIRDNGVVLFCTTGMLLRKMAGNPYLLGVSHLILDEVHEREFLADLTFILLKKVLEKNDRIKIILMSASLNAEVFSKFFKNCPIYQIPGRLFPVEKIYLDQIERTLKKTSNKTNKSNDKRVDYFLINDLIHHINNNEPNNDSILCFLPGWNDIKKVSEDLNKTSNYRHMSAPTMSIIPVHSKLSSEEQKAIFKPLRKGVRKIILSTNIAETSLTVPDVVYVIDPGLCNETYYHKEYNVSTFGTHLISQANAKQREGRAGRVKPGVCYKLYTKETETSSMTKYFVPEMLRIPLETVVMFSKLYCPNEQAVDFLSNALEPPSTDAVLSAVNTLKLISVLDSDEHLTLLGRKVVDLSTHPRLSVSLVTSAMLGCFDKILNLSCMLSTPKDPFVMQHGNKSFIKTIKESLSGTNSSDYVSLYKLVQMYEDQYLYNDIADENFFDKYNQFVNFGTLESAKHLKKLYIKDLYENGISNNNLDFSKSNCFFDLSLISGLYPNVLKYVNEKNSKKFQLIEVQTGHQTSYSSESVLSSSRIENESYFVSTYFDSFYSEERKKLIINNASLVPSVFVLFLCKNINLVKEENSTVTFILDNCKFLIYTMEKQDLRLILKWKDIFQLYQNWYLCNEKNINSSSFSYLNKTFKEFLDITNNVFDRYSRNSEINSID